MAASTDLATAAAVKAYMNISGSGDDALIASLIGYVSEAIEKYCRREFASKTHTEYHDGGGFSKLLLNHRPIISVTSVHDDLDRAFAAASLIDSDDYISRDQEGIIEWLHSSSTFPSTAAYFADGQLNVKVVYVAGYATIPSDLALACMMLVSKLFTRGKQHADGIKSEGDGVYTVIYADGLIAGDEFVKSLLSEYREVRI